jgi:hypothetical protein
LFSLARIASKEFQRATKVTSGDSDLPEAKALACQFDKRRENVLEILHHTGANVELPNVGGHGVPLSSVHKKRGGALLPKRAPPIPVLAQQLYTVVGLMQWYES